MAEAPPPTRWGRSAFHLAGFAGLAAAIVVCGSTLAARHVAWWGLPAIVVTGVATFLGLALAVKVVTGRETLIYYHHEIAVLAACALMAWLTGLPVLASLDATVLGIGAFLIFGRLGCLSVGCCYGRPAKHGIRYGHTHAEAGFPAELVGVRLAPVQAVESGVAAAITATGLLVVAAGGAPGVPLALYVAAYGVARFVLEDWRGDERRSAFGLSEAQWTSLVLVGATAVAGPWWVAIPIVVLALQRVRVSSPVRTAAASAVSSRDSERSSSTRGT